jgi:hypothetical protein
VGHAADTRGLGAHDHEVDVQRVREGEESFTVLGANRMALAQTGDAGTAGCGMQVHRRALPREPPGQGMLPPTGSDQENAHLASLRTTGDAG